MTPQSTLFCTARVEGSCIFEGMQVRELLVMYKNTHQPQFRVGRPQFYLSRFYPSGVIISSFQAILCVLLFQLYISMAFPYSIWILMKAGITAHKIHAFYRCWFANIFLCLKYSLNKNFLSTMDLFTQKMWFNVFFS